MNYFLIFLLATGLTAALTPLVRVLAFRAGLVVEPRKDRWHTRPTPILGGLAIFLSFGLCYLYYLGLSRETLPILAGGMLVFALGLYDDLRGLSPQAKFIGQIAVAALVISMGTVVRIIPYPVIAYPLTFIWIVGLTNAFNLIDNMDGLSAGIAAISAAAMFVFSINSGDQQLALCSLALAGACIGFLFYNFNPARIFMGDCGSMFLGFTLAVLSISGTWKHASSLFITYLVPVLIVGIPIFDTAFVTCMRTLRGQPISQGGRDHMSHRLVSLGFSEKKTVTILYTISAVVALGSLLLNSINPLAFAIVALLLIIGLFYFCVYLGYAESRNGNGNGNATAGYQARALLVNAQRLVQIFVDLVIIAVAYFAAYLIRFEGGLPELQFDYFIKTLPLVVLVKVAVFYYCGLYHAVWRHVGVRDFVNIMKAVLVSSLLIVGLIVFYTRFQYFSRAVFVIDTMLSLLLISGAHFSMRIMREYLESQPQGGRKVLLIGAGDAGELALREIRNNPALKFDIVGFLDDDAFKQQRRIHGVRVLGRIEDVGPVSQRTGAHEALIAIPSASMDILGRIAELCQQHHVACRNFFERDA